MFSESVQTTLLLRDAKVISRDFVHFGSVGRIVNVYLKGGSPWYTLHFQDNQLGEYAGSQIQLVTR